MIDGVKLFCASTRFLYQSRPYDFESFYFKQACGFKFHLDATSDQPLNLIGLAADAPPPTARSGLRGRELPTVSAHPKIG
ncbi:hypothetical protein ACLBXJ_27595 [Methylobacterium mesophilicum]